MVPRHATLVKLGKANTSAVLTVKTNAGLGSVVSPKIAETFPAVTQSPGLLWGQLALQVHLVLMALPEVQGQLAPQVLMALPEVQGLQDHRVLMVPLGDQDQQDLLALMVHLDHQVRGLRVSMEAFLLWITLLEIYLSIPYLMGILLQALTQEIQR